MKLTCISDTHNKLKETNPPAADVLIISGDITATGTIAEISKFNYELGMFKDRFKFIILIAGNHDFLFQKDPNLAKSLISNVTHYLQDEMVELDGIKFYGSPWQPYFYDWAFNLHRGEPIKAKWDLIPNGIDVLITHGPVAGILDVNDRGESIGCKDLFDAVLRVNPKLHICGHNHSGYGIKKFHNTTFVNASSFDRGLKHKPIEIEI